MLSKKIIVPMAAVAVIGAGLYGVTRVSAASDTVTDPQASLIQKLVDTFHLDKSKVQAVFDQNRADHQAQHETTYEQRLSQAVTNGKLTAAQKSAILAEHTTLAGELKDATAKTGADRRTALRQIHDEAQTWAMQNHISPHWLMGFGPHPHGGHGHIMGPDGHAAHPGA